MKYYLAYGMNTNLSEMSRRCPNAKSLGKVTVPDYRLAFKTHCDVVYTPGDTMECVLWSITDDCELALDQLEGFPEYYNKREVQVKYNGKTIRPMIYYMCSGFGYAAPSEHYLNMVVEGYSKHNIPILQIITALEDITRCTSLSAQIEPVF